MLNSYKIFKKWIERLIKKLLKSNHNFWILSKYFSQKINIL